jgi:hypothetical protein
MNDCDSGIEAFFQKIISWESHYLGSKRVRKEETKDPSAFWSPFAIRHSNINPPSAPKFRG